MGGSSKKATVGYKYYLGMHMILCHGPVDKITRIRVGSKNAWVGNRRSGRISINKPSLFGGESREGGIQGEIDFEPGEATQGKNSYLAARLGNLIPNFRGVCGVVLRQCYIGMNPYLKAWNFRVTRIMKRQDGQSQWYPATASIPTVESFTVRQRILFCIDDSGSMDETVGLGVQQTRMDVLKDNMINILDEIGTLTQDANVPVDVAIDLMNGGSMSRTAIDAGDISDLKDYVLGIDANGGTDFTGHFSYAKSWFSAHSGERRNVMLIVTDGEPSDIQDFNNITLPEAEPILERTGTWSGNNEVDVHAVNVDAGNTNYSEQIDNTPGDDVPVIDGSSSSELYNAVFFAFMGSSPAMNIIHAIRECITDPIWGMGYPESELDDTSFRAAALRLRNERLGICLLWDRQKPVEEIIQELLNHADASLYIDRRTGLFTIKLIRDDYDVDEILHLTEENIVKVENFQRSAFGELTTAVTVNYWNVKTGETASVTAEDIALANMQQATVSTTLQYPGIPDPIMASRIAQRELKGLSNQLASCTIYTDRSARNLVLGDVVKVTWPDYELDEAVFRVMGIAYGDGKENRIKLTVSEDVFATPDVSLVSPSEPEWEDPSQPPEAVERQVAFEAPYLELVQRQGNLAVDEVLANNPDAGFVGTAGATPGGSSINARAYMNNGAGYDDIGLVDFSPAADLAAPVGKYDTTFPLVNMEALDEVELETWAQIGEELVAVVSIDEEAEEMVVRRAVLDTVPAEHEAGAPIIFWDDFSTVDDTEYVTSDEVSVKLAPVSGSGELELEDATELNVTVEGRAYRPFRPADLRLEDDPEPDPAAYPDYPATISWVHRNRLQETGGVLIGWQEASIAPEEGTTYKVVVEALEDDLETVVAVAYEEAGIDATEFLLEATMLGEYAVEPFVRVYVYAQRDGVDSWRAGSLVFRGPFQSPNNLVAAYLEPKAPQAVVAAAVRGQEALEILASITEL